MKNDGLFDQARDAVSCVTIAERRVTLKEIGPAWRGICPLKDCGAKSKSAPFMVIDKGRRWRCFSCDPTGGDVIDLEHRLFGGGDETLRDAALRLVGGVVQEESEESRARRAQEQAARAAAAEADEAWKAALARRLWREAKPATGTLVQDYLEARAIRGPVAARMLELVRFHPSAWHSGDPERGVRLPAMINLGMTELGPTGGIHVTYLAPNGKAKTHRDPQKRMLGPQGRFVLARKDGGYGPPVRVLGEALEGYVLPAGYWLTRPDAPGPLVVAEGHENAASRAMMLAGDLSLPVRAVAAGDLRRVQGGELSEQGVLVDAWNGARDPMRPPFTWPEDPRAPWGVVDIACDSDMSTVTVKGRSGRNRVGKSRVIDIRRDAHERARICGRLAVAAWCARLDPNSKTVVRASRPPEGLDFNDLMRAAEKAVGDA